MYYFGGGGGLSEKVQNLIRLESKMERKPYSYMSELFNIESEFNSSVELFHQHTVMEILNIMIVDSDSDPTTTVAENLADCAMFLARVSRFYREPPLLLNDFPLRLIHLLASYARYIPSTPRFKLAQALTLLDASVSIINIDDTLSLFMLLQTLGDQKLTNLASNHVFHSLRRTCNNNQHRTTQKYQTLMFNMLQVRTTWWFVNSNTCCYSLIIF
jgi:protein SDA1